MPKNPVITHEFTFPLKGFYHGDVTQRPEGTSAHLLNVMGRDRNGVYCGASRAGLKHVFPSAMTNALSAEPGILGMTQAVTILNGDAVRQLAFACGGQVYACRYPNQPYKIDQFGIAVDAGLGSPSVFMVATPQFVYVLTGGSQLVYFPWATAPVEEATNALVMTFNDTITNFPGGTFGVIWRSRMVVAGVPGSPQLVYASAIADDYISNAAWDTADLSPDGAWALNASTAGTIGDAVTALVNFTDDTLVIAGRRTLWRLDGDPKAGGSLSLISPVVGIAQQTAWCHDPQGTLYFFGNEAFYRYSPITGQLEDLSSRRALRHFKRIDPKTDYINCVFDHKYRGVWLFSVGIDEGLSHVENCNAWFYDIEMDALYPMRFPLAAGPVSAMYYGGGRDTDANIEDKAQMLLGTFDGRVLGMDNQWADDDGETINSFIHLEHFQPQGPMGNAKLIRCQIVLGPQQAKIDVDAGRIMFADADWHVDLSIFAGRSVLEVGQDATYISAPTNVNSFAGTFTQSGWNGYVSPHTTGNTFVLRLSCTTAGKIWAMDRITGEFLPAGRTR